MLGRNGTPLLSKLLCFCGRARENMATQPHWCASKWLTISSPEKVHVCAYLGKFILHLADKKER